MQEEISRQLWYHLVLSAALFSPVHAWHFSCYKSFSQTKTSHASKVAKQFMPMLLAKGKEGGDLKQSKKRCFQEEKGLYLDYAENHLSYSSFSSQLNLASI